MRISIIVKADAKEDNVKIVSGLKSKNKIIEIKLIK